MKKQKTRGRRFVTQRREKRQPNSLSIRQQQRNLISCGEGSCWCFGWNPMSRGKLFKERWGDRRRRKDSAQGGVIVSRNNKLIAQPQKKARNRTANQGPHKFRGKEKSRSPQECNLLQYRARRMAVLGRKEWLAGPVVGSMIWKVGRGDLFGREQELELRNIMVKKSCASKEWE